DQMLIEKSRKEIFKDARALHFSSEKDWVEPSEWLETNGLGGWASSSITGCNTRRYHGLLVAATNPPVERMALVSKLDEKIIVGNDCFELGTNDYGTVLHPEGFRYLQSFRKGLFPEWHYELGGVELKKTIAMVQGENTTPVLYELKRAPSSVTLALLPLISARYYHTLQHSTNNIFWDVEFNKGVFKTLPYEGAPEVFISIPGATYQHHPRWFYDFNYSIEKFRGLDYKEDLFNHGTFSLELKEGDKLGIILSVDKAENRNACDLFEKEKKRKEALLKNEQGEITKQLKLVADQFIVKRGVDLKTIIAGYHWFTDWGRDTMISL